MHTDMRNRNLADPMRERCREIWWTIYILDAHMAALMGVPQSLSEHDVTAPLPEFAASSSKALALGIHVKLARATSNILQSEFMCFRCHYLASFANATYQQFTVVKVGNRASSCTVSRMRSAISPASMMIEWKASGYTLATVVSLACPLTSYYSSIKYVRFFPMSREPCRLTVSCAVHYSCHPALTLPLLAAPVDIAAPITYSIFRRCALAGTHLPRSGTADHAYA